MPWSIRICNSTGNEREKRRALRRAVSVRNGNVADIFGTSPWARAIRGKG